MTDTNETGKYIFEGEKWYFWKQAQESIQALGSKAVYPHQIKIKQKQRSQGEDEDYKNQCWEVLF